MAMRPGKAGEAGAHLAVSGTDSQELLEAIRAYWNVRIHDLEIAQHPVGTQEFFEELAAYRFEKLDYLPRVVDFSAYEGKRLLEVGCGIGIDLVRFAKHGAVVTGIDLAEQSITLARQNFALHGLHGDLQTMNGEHLQFGDGSFEVLSQFSVLLPLTVIADQLGVPRKDLRRFKRWTDGATTQLSGMADPEESFWREVRVSSSARAAVRASS